MGSGHILAYLFDVLMQIYRSAGYGDRDAAASVVEHNLYGLDIDDRAAQMAYFVVMMKGCQYDSRFPAAASESARLCNTGEQRHQSQSAEILRQRAF